MGIDRDSKTPVQFDDFTEKTIFDKVQPAHIFVCKMCGKQFGNSEHVFMEHMKEIHGMNVSKMSHEGEEFHSISNNK